MRTILRYYLWGSLVLSGELFTDVLLGAIDPSTREFFVIGTVKVFSFDEDSGQVEEKGELKDLPCYWGWSIKKSLEAYLKEGKGNEQIAFRRRWVGNRKEELEKFRKKNPRDLSAVRNVNKFKDPEVIEEELWGDVQELAPEVSLVRILDYSGCEERMKEARKEVREKERIVRDQESSGNAKDAELRGELENLDEKISQLRESKKEKEEAAALEGAKGIWEYILKKRKDNPVISVASGDESQREIGNSVDKDSTSPYHVLLKAAYGELFTLFEAKKEDISAGGDIKTALINASSACVPVCNLSALSNGDARKHALDAYQGNLRGKSGFGSIAVIEYMLESSLLSRRLQVVDSQEGKKLTSNLGNGKSTIGSCLLVEGNLDVMARGEPWVLIIQALFSGILEEVDRLTNAMLCNSSGTRDLESIERKIGKLEEQRKQKENELSQIKGADLKSIHEQGEAEAKLKSLGNGSFKMKVLPQEELKKPLSDHIYTQAEARGFLLHKKGVEPRQPRNNVVYKLSCGGEIRNALLSGWEIEVYLKKKAAKKPEEPEEPEGVSSLQRGGLLFFIFVLTFFVTIAVAERLVRVLGLPEKKAVPDGQGFVEEQAYESSEEEEWDPHSRTGTSPPGAQQPRQEPQEGLSGEQEGASKA